MAALGLVTLPIDSVLPALLRAVREERGAVLRAPTGAGKTTRVPPALLDDLPTGQVIVLEPRRVAARAAARRIAEERGGRLGGEVGYQVRFERKGSAATRLWVVTEGVLLRKLQDDPLLEGVAAIVLDEFHERSLTADLALALSQRVRTDVRPDLRLVVMSATLDPQPVAAYLGGVPIIESEGRSFPVEIEYVAEQAEVRIERAVRSAVLDVARREAGDVLVFLPGVGEIRRVARALEGDQEALDLDVVMLHGELPAREQDRALAPGPRRRVILATNVAETSVTVPGVRVVIDTGYERLPRIDPGVGLERLELVRISRESAEQRAGRAGRTAPGRCIRLWGRGTNARLAAHRLPAIRRTDLAGAALELHAWGETDLRAFPWFESPPEAALAQAEQLLGRLGALDAGRLTPLGRRMATVPAHPRLARMLAESERVGNPRRLALAAAVLSDRSPFVRADRRVGALHHGRSDLLDAVEALEAFEAHGRLDAGMRTLRRGPARQALRARDQLARGRGAGRAPRRTADADEAVLRAVLAAFPDRVARRREPGSDRAILVGGRGLRLAPSSSVRDAPLFVAVELDAGRPGEQSEAEVRLASAISESWLDAARCRATDVVQFDPTRQAVTGSRRQCYDDLVLTEVALQVPRGPEVERVLTGAASEALGSALPLDNEAVASFRTRVACLADWHPELGLPEVDDDAIRALLPALVHGLRSFEELRRAPLLDHLRGRFSWSALEALDREAPERVLVPSGSRIRLHYEPGRPPVLAVRIQEVFGLTETPRIAGGRVKVLMHLLAPNGRPQQITDDMPSFWANTYAGVRAELRRRYPKHAWPEDPTTARAARRPGRRR